ncbi:AAA family ATPase [Oscillatoriales cyanobacterium LEGE 11467]|uniref:histidine kinase n=1 Tax=Zarconia navalis LEGE 11467 TaxID=1828826 RepID=A0A928VUZ3_9CYAN|nr:ATP-binding sensor histidine kinase [Zarconia navalis]MBE9039783.1 AAA family ATPase [Zarconia navalis LEGE 11467]
MTTLSGYHLGETLYQGTRTLVYRATHTAQNKPVVIKFLRNEYPTFSELVQFRNQYTVTKNLDEPGIVKPLALETYGNGYALVMPDTGYISLGEWKEEQLAIADFLNIAIQLAEILHGLYQNRVIHKDIKPANVLIHPETKQVKLIDFSISSLLPKETQEISNPNVLEGTLAYISPEQTGRMNRGIDYRTDFYSLGVTFYELLTVELPFQCDDPMELVHCHIAKMPVGLEHREEIPQVLASIVMKLMAKNAEDRYQSALGLKQDLEKCLFQWKETGKIEPFKLGERDICDRFMIPEKLYGREAEVETLLSAFDRVAAGNTEMMLVTGLSGIGKTAVVNEVHKPIVRQRGYFIKGKFDQFNRNIPFSAFVQAFRDLMGQLLSESETQLQQWQAKIQAALGENGQVIVDVVPELERIIGKQPPVLELSGSAAQNRFNLLFGKFVRVFATKDHPLVIFLDDLQWADSASLNLMQLLMEATDTSYLLSIGAYRDNEVFPAHPLMLTLDKIIKAGGLLDTICLQPLSPKDLNRLVADSLICSESLALPLTELISQKTKGNPFFAVQFLKGLYEEQLITFDWQVGSWQCDMSRVTQLSLTDDVVEFMMTQLQKLPVATQEILKLAACIGNRFDLETLAIVSDRSSEDVATVLWQALQEGLVLPKNEVYKFYQSQSNDRQSSIFDDRLLTYQFLHDRVQQAAYSLIQSDRKKSTHLKIGQRLLDNTPEEKLNEKIFEIVNQLNVGVESNDRTFDRDRLVQLNLMAGRQAKETTAYKAAANYLAVARSFIPASSWDERYSLTLSLYRESAISAYLCADFEEMEKFIDIVENYARTLLDAIPVYEVRMQAGMAQNKLPEAIKTGRDVLSKLGIEFPEQPSPPDIEATLSHLFSKLDRRNPLSFIELPFMTDPASLASMRILKSLAPCAYQAMPMLLPLVVMKQVELSIDRGNSALSPLGYAYFALILCGVVGDIETGYKFGQLALKLLDLLDAKEIKAGTIFVVNADAKPYREAVKDTLQPLQSVYTIGLETGDFEFAALATYIYSYHAYLAGESLPDLSREIENYNQNLSRLKQQTVLNFNQILLQSISNLMGLESESCQLRGAIYNDTEMLPVHREANDATAIYYVYFNKMILGYLLGETQQAVENAAETEKYLHGVTANLVVPLFYFYDSLIALVNVKDLTGDRREKAIDKVKSNQEKMQNWANYAPMNFQHKYDLVEAEKSRVLGNKLEAIELYDLAIVGARINEYLQEVALANELAAKFYLDWGKEQIAQTYMVEAYYGYARWGAKAKTDHLNATYPQLLAPIFQQPTPPLSLNAKTTLTSHQTLRTSTSANTSLLDISAAIRASQALSGEIELEALLSKLMQIVLENAGADKGALILNNAGTWEVVTQCIGETCELFTTPLEVAESLPASIIRVVQRTRKSVILNQVEKDIRFASDTYLIRQQPKSLFCTPILSQGQLIGILYLENNPTTGVFTTERVEVLNLLCSQAAISIENARLYERSQNYAKTLEGTVQELQQTQQQLQSSFEDLKQAQLQMVQSEKMSALGNLVAGVAHEINNPVGFIGGNLQPARDYVQDLLGLIDLYQEKLPNPDEELEEEIEAIDLDFLREDLPKLIDSMKLGVDRIGHISTSLRTFSRTDKEYQVPFNLHDGIDSTLLILKHRLKVNEHRPAIEIVKEYGDIPEVQCFPGQLNQVFMNLIANAIDALDEGNRGRSFEEIAANPNQITIQTDILEDRVTIRISDNGVGMPEDIKQRIFEQGFTTKGVGKGTGLGMAIARQIVEEKHGGTISCTSEPGIGTEFSIALPIG